ncbi:hypothetical protein [Brucella pseudintermedia]|uniref:hypothetical protein n=1 Tax=Brucella pseudintermedia TaxID=370111 RepID=UPI00124CC313|nr:hypothetical protein [Brucella pseudintermedia]KAB2680935.1 hypothetical protein F9K78_15105 [Brucella pseudintermedia]
MTARTDRRGFAKRPADPDGWIKAGNTPPPRNGAAVTFTARLTIDVTPELRGRIKIAAFCRGVTVADMLRELFEREFPDTQGDTP